MRQNSKEWTISGAAVQGHAHAFRGVNCQDAFGFFVQNGFLFGVVCDGCGGGNHNEVGAKLLANRSMQEVSRMIAMDRDVHDMPQELFGSLVRFIDMMLYMTSPNVENAAYYVKHYWSATILGFILDCRRSESGDRGVVFHAGDGTWCFNNTAMRLNSPLNDEGAETPKYLAYHCIKNPAAVGVPSEVIPNAFETLPLDCGDSLQRVMIGTDGFCTHQTNKLLLARQREPSLPDELYCSVWGKKGNFGLKKWMNSRLQRGYFDDDCAIVVAERLDDPNHTD